VDAIGSLFGGPDDTAVNTASRSSVQRVRPSFLQAPRSMRHSSIGRALLKNVPIKIVADWHDTSVGIIEKHYARFIINSADTLICDALLDTSPPEGPAKVVTLAA
jgi:hypothetical protein